MTEQTLLEVVAQPVLTILVAAWNEAENIEPFIQSYLDLTYPNKELVLCAGGTDATLERALAYTSDGIRVIRQQPGDGKQGALRRAFDRVSGEIVVLTDADCVLSDEGMERLIAPIVAGEGAVATGISAPKRQQLSHPFVYYQYAVQNNWNELLGKRRNTQALLGRNCAVSRNALIEVGAFNEDVAIGTDSFLAKKLLASGYEVLFVPDSVVETEFLTHLIAYCRQRARWRRNAITHNLRFRHIRRAMAATRAPARGLAMILVPVMALRHSKLLLPIWLAALAYTFTTRLRYLRRAQRTGISMPRSVYWYLPAYIYAEWAAQVLAILQLPFSRARKQW